MDEAEKVKVLSEKEKENPPPVSSIFNSLFGTSKPSAQPVTNKASVPDFHDYTEVIRQAPPKAPNSTTPSTTNSKSTGSTAGRGRGGVTSVSGRTGTTSGRIAGSTVKRNSGTSSGASSTKLPADPPATSTKTSEYETQIMSEMLDSSPGVRWEDIAGLGFAKQTLQEAVILPNLRPDLFTGLRSPPKGVLLFGPPGTGKTLLAKAVATESGFCFFSITSSAVTSKYLGEGEKLMKALFEVARSKQPSVIFFDEIDALMSTRKENEHEASRRLKTEFMTQVDGATTSAEDRILIMAATNIPWEIDEAVLRRLAKRIYVPLPDPDSRRALITRLLIKHSAGGPTGGKQLSSSQLERIVQITEGYSGSDLSAVCHEAALGPIRELGAAALRTIKAEEVRCINDQDFVNAVRNIRPSVSQDTLQAFVKWSQQFGVSR
eukprot:gene26162-32697_t